MKKPKRNKIRNMHIATLIHQGIKAGPHGKTTKAKRRQQQVDLQRHVAGDLLFS